jgi:hypothetical protein
LKSKNFFILAEKPSIVPSNKLGILEEDDEFEEFPVEGIFTHFKFLSFSFC